jgi:hypothetical protein
MAGSRLTTPGDFDVLELWAAVDAPRVTRDMTWHAVATTGRGADHRSMKRPRVDTFERWRCPGAA